LFLLFGTVVVI